MRLHDQRQNENSNGKRLGPHAANLGSHYEEMKAAPPSASWLRKARSLARPLVGLLRKDEARYKLPTEIGLPVRADEVARLRVETAVALGAIIVPSRRPGRGPIGSRTIDRRRWWPAHRGATSALPRRAPTPKPTRPGPHPHPQPAFAGAGMENMPTPINAAAVMAFKGVCIMTISSSGAGPSRRVAPHRSVLDPSCFGPSRKSPGSRS